MSGGRRSAETLSRYSKRFLRAHVGRGGKASRVEASEVTPDVSAGADDSASVGVEGSSGKETKRGGCKAAEQAGAESTPKSAPREKDAQVFPAHETVRKTDLRDGETGSRLGCGIGANKEKRLMPADAPWAGALHASRASKLAKAGSLESREESREDAIGNGEGAKGFGEGAKTKATCPRVEEVVADEETSEPDDEGHETTRNMNLIAVWPASTGSLFRFLRR